MAGTTTGPRAQFRRGQRLTYRRGKPHIAGVSGERRRSWRIPSPTGSRGAGRRSTAATPDHLVAVGAADEAVEVERVAIEQGVGGERRPAAALQAREEGTLGGGGDCRRCVRERGEARTRRGVGLATL